MGKDVWRSVKFDRCAEEPLPSGTIMLHCIFKDNYGNPFKWTPRWRDVEDIFVRSAQIEGKNAPEGAWDEELKAVFQKIPYKQHDIEIFQKADAIMSEKNVVAFLYSLQAGHSYTSSQSLKLAEFLCFFDYESNRYVSRKLYDLAERMCNALAELAQFLSDKVYANRFPGGGGDTQMRLYPYFDIVVRNRQDEEKWREQYDGYVAELDKLAEAAQQAYKDYRIHIRGTLFQ